MRFLTGKEEKTAIAYIEKAAEIALSSWCDKHCWSIIVKDEQIIGSWYNGPPGGNAYPTRCNINKNSYHPKVSDKTCCMHAEQRAIMDALANNSDKIVWSRLYFIRTDERGNPEHAGKPWCTICSKMSLDAGISEFVLWHEDWVCVYPTDEYNMISYQYSE